MPHTCATSTVMYPVSLCKEKRTAVKGISAKARFTDR